MQHFGQFFLDQSFLIFSYDGSIVKVHQDATRSCLDKPNEAMSVSVGGLSTKIHSKVRSFRQFMTIILSPSQANESQFVFEVYYSEPCEFFPSDKAYDIDAFRDHLKKMVLKPLYRVK